jgi:uncharacterized membrane protein YjdF
VSHGRYVTLLAALLVLLAGTMAIHPFAAFLGTQGDAWDAHKDMALASLGALIAMLATAGLNAGLQRDFAREWVAGLRVGGVLPGAKA